MSVVTTVEREREIYFCGGSLKTNRRPLAASAVSYIGMFVNNFLLDRTASLSAMYFQCLLGGSILTVKIDKRTRSCLDVSASLGLLHYWREEEREKKDREENRKRERA